MTTPVITPKVIYSDVIEAVPYNYNVPVDSEVEVIVEFVDVDGNDLLADITYNLILTKSMGSLLFDTNTIELTWVGAGTIPLVNTLTIYRKTSELQQTVFEFNADISIETAQEVDRLTRAQQDTNEKLDSIDLALENINDNINPIIVEANLTDGAVTTIKIADAAVTEAKIADGSVTASKLGSGAVTNVKLAANSVTETKILNGAVTSAKIVDEAITTAKILDDAVTTAKIADTSITEAKLATDVLSLFDQNIPFRLSTSTYSSNRVRIEAAEIPLNNSSKIAIGTGTSIIKFDGLEIDFVTGHTYSLTNVLVGTGVYTFPIPSAGQYRTYLIEASFDAVNAVGKTPLILDVVGGQEAPILGNQVYPELSSERELAIGYVTVQESGGSLAAIVNTNLVTLENSSNNNYNNIARIRVASHLFNVGDKLVPVYWNGSAWVEADGSDIETLATHLIIEVLSATEFTLAYSGRIFAPAHGLSVGAYYFLGEDTGVLSLIEADDFSNPLLQVEDANYFTLLGWRANQKFVTTDITGVERILVPTLTSSTPTLFTSSLVNIYSISVYNTTRKKIDTDEIEIRIDDIEPNKFTLFSTSNWLDLRVDLIGVK